MLRLFVALALPHAVRDSLVPLQGGVPGARWSLPESLHVTLRFIGEVDDHIAGDLNAELGRLSAPGFELRLEGVGHWGTSRHATQLWAGVQKSPALQFLRDKVDRAVVAAGLPADDRKFRPHATVARLRDAPLDRVRRWLSANALYQSPVFTVDHFILYRSHLLNSGAVHEPLAEYGLAGDPPAGGSERLAADQPGQRTDDAHGVAHEEALERGQPADRDEP